MRATSLLAPLSQSILLNYGLAKLRLVLAEFLTNIRLRAVHIAAMADDSETDIWASPTNDAPRPRTPKTPKTPRTPTGNERTSGTVDHEASLRKELEGVKNINRAIEGVIATLERTGSNMNVRLSIQNTTITFS